jgi:hypothetical protein
MEVHHHPHIPTHAKPWKEYLLEGLMIFVAVTLGYGAENVREHYVETKKALISAKNLYVDVTYDSIGYARNTINRSRQDSCFEIINAFYNNKTLDKEIPSVYAAHGYITRRMLYQMNTLALDEVKSSGTLKFLESDELKAAIQRYASFGSGLKLREQREFSYIDRMLDPISTKNFEFNFNRASGDNFKIKDNKIVVGVPIPTNLKIMKKDQLDWDNYIAILGMLQTIRLSTNIDYIEPTQKQCHELLTLLRNYLIEHDALENSH